MRRYTIWLTATSPTFVEANYHTQTDDGFVLWKHSAIKNSDISIGFIPIGYLWSFENI